MNQQTVELPFDNLEQIAQVLNVTFTGDTNTVKQATDLLDQMANTDYLRFARNLFEIINIQNAEDQQMRIKNAGIIALTRITLTMVKANSVNVDMRNFAIKGVIESLYSDYVTLPMKVNLQYFLLLLYTMDTGSQMINEGLILVKEKLASKTLSEYPPTFLVLQSIINTNTVPQESAANWFQELSESMIEIGGGLTQGIMEEVKGVVEETDVQKQEQKLVGVYTGLKVLKLWLVTLHEFIKVLGSTEKDKKHNASHLKVVAGNERLAIVMTTILMIHFEVPSQVKECIISTSGKDEADNLINTVKSSVIKSFNKILDSLGALLQVLNVEDNHFFKSAHSYLIGAVLHSIIVFCRAPEVNLEEVSKNKDTNELLLDIFNFMNRMVSFPTVLQLVGLVSSNLAIDVCLPFMRTDRAELNQFRDNPEQFVSISSDITGRKNSATLKVQAAKFLARLALSADGCLTYLMKFILALLEYSMLSNKPEDLPNFKDLSEHHEAVIIVRTDPAIRVETLLLTLSALHNEILARPKDILPLVGELFKVCQQFFLGPDSNNLIKARVCLMFPFYAGSVFGEEKAEIYKEYLKFILQCLTLEGEENAALQEQASNSLYTMFERQKTAVSLTPYVSDIIKALATIIQGTEKLKIFDTVYEIISEYEFQMLEEPNAFLDMLKALVERGHKEFQILQKTPDGSKLVLNKIWNVIRGIADRQEYVLTLQEDIEAIIDPLLSHFEQSKEIGFDEDILNYIASATGCKGAVSQATWKVFSSFPKVFAQYEFMLSTLFPALNQIIIHGDKTINSDPQSIHVLIEMGVAALNPKCKQADEANVAEGALLMQLILQYLDPITTEQMEFMLTNTFEKLLTVKEEHDFLKARLGGVFLCSFLKNFPVAQEILLRINALTPVMDLFLKNALAFEETPYDRKLLIIGLSSILLHQNICAEITFRFPEMFDIMISFLRYTEYMDRFESKANELLDESDSDLEEETIKTNKNILKTFLDKAKELGGELEEPGDEIHDKDGDDSEEEDGHGPYIPGRVESNHTVKGLATALKKQDEFEFFKKGVLAMRDNRIEVLKELVESLPDKKKHFLNEVLMSQRIELKNTGKLEARRIVKSAARKVANVQFTNGEFQPSK